jgi:hypothetical protein
MVQIGHVSGVWGDGKSRTVEVSASREFSALLEKELIDEYQKEIDRIEDEILFGNGSGVPLGVIDMRDYE